MFLTMFDLLMIYDHVCLNDCWPCFTLFLTMVFDDCWPCFLRIFDYVFWRCLIMLLMIVDHVFWWLLTMFFDDFRHFSFTMLYPGFWRLLTMFFVYVDHVFMFISHYKNFGILTIAIVPITKMWFWHVGRSGDCDFIPNCNNCDWELRGGH
jgi:hypothetical protein